MQTGKKAVESVKETASNIAASAKSGMDKTKATVQEKVDKMKADDDYDKALASEKKQDRVTEAELRKQQAMSHNAAEKDAKTAVAGQTGTGGTGYGTTGPQYSHSTTGATGYPTGAHQMSAMPGHGTGEPAGGHVMDGTAVGSHPIGRGTGTNTRSSTAQNRHVGGGTNTDYTGTGYSG
ncbi:late embryogenesis abundant protein 46 [Beta vulgaris subsp. vulgaris]|uniref:late embryogenesis abundant protein 46 n=1 Tax=Beta vulgaris subsp. vulgaris TaxID=3555 RepID=UPI002036D9C9|nr:late embryogenesis abundant protein 46 [Beta vulgaris subsp. vulgaris]